MELAAAENINIPEVPPRQDLSSKTADSKKSRTQKATPPATDRVSLSTPETSRKSMGKEIAPSVPVSREEMAALFESFTESFRFSVKA